MKGEGRVISLSQIRMGRCGRTASGLLGVDGRSPRGSCVCPKVQLVWQTQLRGRDGETGASRTGRRRWTRSRVVVHLEEHS